MAADLLHHHRHHHHHHHLRHSPPFYPSSVPFAPPSRSLVRCLLSPRYRPLAFSSRSRSDDEFIGGSRAEWPCIWPTEWPACFVRKANAENEAFIGARRCTELATTVLATFPPPLLPPLRRTVFSRPLGSPSTTPGYLLAAVRPGNCRKFLLSNRADDRARCAIEFTLERRRTRSSGSLNETLRRSSSRRSAPVGLYARLHSGLDRFRR